MWNGDNLWYDHWQQIWGYGPAGGAKEPEWVEIISWNDFSESHYIGPLDSSQYDAFTIGKAPYNYVENMPHDGWRVQLPYMIDMYKAGTATAEQESVLQYEIPPNEITVDQISIMALMTGPADIYLGWQTGLYSLEWKYTPQGQNAPGLYYAVFETNGTTSLSSQNSGGLTLELTRIVQGANGAVELIVVDIPEINAQVTDTCTDDITNWNAIVQYGTGSSVAIKSNMTLSQQVCIKGWSYGAFDEICGFTCSLGYCPFGACVCEQIGPQPKLPTDGGTPVNGYSANGDPDYDGLCSFACGLGEDYCFPAYCSQTPTPVVIPSSSPFNPLSCQAGTSSDPTYADICAFTCSYGFCPYLVCTCTQEGPTPVQANDDTSITAQPKPGIADHGMCQYACSHGWCPDICTSNEGCVSGSGSGGYEGLCDFSCGRGFCPSPYTCSASASAPTPTAGYLPNVVGYGIPGLAADYDPLCNFTCNHGYCPAGVCGQAISVTATPASGVFATITGLKAESATPTYSPGALFEYTNPDNESLIIDVMIMNTGASADIDSFACTDEPAVSGPDGEALGCIAEGTAWGGGDHDPGRGHGYQQQEEAQGQDRDDDDEGAAQQQPHLPVPRRLAAQRELLDLLGVWVPAGNGTSSSGVYHELHFIRSGSVHGHVAYRGGYLSGDDSGNTTTVTATTTGRSGPTLASRQYKLIRPFSGFRYYRDNAAKNYGNGFFVQTPGNYQYDPYDFAGVSVEKTAVEAATTALQNDCNHLAYYTGCTGNIGDILESGVVEPEDPNDYSTEVEVFEWELDCYIGGVADSGDSSDNLIYPLEQRRKRSISEYLEVLPPKLLEGLDLDLEDDSKATRAHVYSLLEKRAGSRPQGICKNPPGKNRKAVMTSLSSSPYRNVKVLVETYGTAIIGLDGRACAAGIQTWNSIASIPKGMKPVAEHVMEIQFVKSFFQGMRDGTTPGGGSLSTGQLSWVLFNQSNPAQATIFASWSSVLSNGPSLDGTVYKSFYNVLGTLSDTSNNLMLDSLTNGLKATIYRLTSLPSGANRAGAKNIVAASKWDTTGHAARLGTFNRIKAVFDYINTADAQNSLSTAYGKIHSLCVYLTAALSNNNQINYDTTTAFTEFSRAQFSYMVTNVQNWITSKLADEATYWGSAAAAKFYGQVTADINLARVQSLQTLSWLKITTT
ncbi:hypothetical protein QBC46DRAFT_452559 [Diplogelasinospora grovesii]|uniref:Glycoside hydrolase family 71 protein n=1 Tax=Diplogelasinospora grovesii TaxID=303347 RepID=A0AAN6N2K6_9PEZI|nr:hypothetical protein QBC46DRAFT_452559 [Diplogelasinospora grovesii]